MKTLFDNNNRKELKANILKLAFSLEEQYTQLNFKHHCYLRIAYDNCVQDKWNNVIKSPFLTNCNNVFMSDVLNLLKLYKNSQNFLLEHNQISLNYRKK